MFATMDGNDRQNIEYHLKTIEKDNDVIKNLSQQIIISLMKISIPQQYREAIQREIIESTLNSISRNILFYDQLFKLLR